MFAYKVLIVDDEPENIKTIAEMLEREHPEYRLYQATTGQTALEIAKDHKTDLVISDWQMPGMSGIELTKALKSDPDTHHIPVIIVTGVMLTPADLEIALAAGAHDYMRKPVDAVELSARTHSALRIVSMHLQDIQNKNKELDEKTLLLIKNNQFNINLEKKLSNLVESENLSAKAKSDIREIINALNEKLNEDNWQQFEIAFHNVYPGFSNSLLSRFPELTPGELKHSILISLGLNIKDMASVLHQHPDSIKVTRSRIRRKLGLSNEINLQSFLMMI